MANFLGSIMPAFSGMAAPLADLLKASSGAQKINWSVECEIAFNLIKSTLTSAPVLRHFDPAQRTAVHVDGSQNAVGAVIVWGGWEEKKTEARDERARIQLGHMCFG